jgi:hypothetical protein
MSRSFGRYWWGLLLVALVPGSTCHKPAVRAGLDEAVSLRKGQWVSFRHRLPLEMAFLGVSEDSRCPRDVQCIQAGHAVVRFAAKSAEGGFDTFLAELPAGAPADSIPWTTWSSYRVRVLELDPYPRAGVPVDSSAFRVTFVVRKA